MCLLSGSPESSPLKFDLTCERVDLGARCPTQRSTQAKVGTGLNASGNLNFDPIICCFAIAGLPGKPIKQHTNRNAGQPLKTFIAFFGRENFAIDRHLLKLMH